MIPQNDLYAFIENWLSAWTGNRPEVLIEYYTENAFYCDPARPAGLIGRSEILAYFQKLLAKNPDWRWQAVKIFPNPKGFTLKWKAEIPTPAAGVVEIYGMDLVELEDNKIARNEVYFNPAALLAK